ncbi:hypothetical protein BLL52_2460 [Rhodoferax antarcticus ANT.BR]|uniref:Uncharacterized protein n=1 Tax=Rhodoferax antarcticus ANT.BR TaxID=1111071 RepID=A0A1Q8YE81_9BURK|nr:hypothetical protein BLL52_2460 [Rhodoferax antarcticus ANT.BR]
MDTPECAIAQTLAHTAQIMGRLMTVAGIGFLTALQIFSKRGVPQPWRMRQHCTEPDPHETAVLLDSDAQPKLQRTQR